MKSNTFIEKIIRNPIIQMLVIYISGGWIVLEIAEYFIENFGLDESARTILLILLVIGLPVAIFFALSLHKKKHETPPEKLALIEKASAKDEKLGQHNLPIQLTSFIGREKEMKVIRQLISKQRMVTLIGAGGCGKTRLAIEVAAQLIPDYEDGVWFVELAPIASQDLVAKEITEVLKIKEVPNQTIIETLIYKIKDKNLLIILDNCEHLVQACAEIVVNLIQSVPGLKILATSREALCITGEHVWRIPSLTLIDPKKIINVEYAKNSEAVLLFTDRARMNNPEFELETANVNEVVTICNKLDGIPLALELVASRTRHMNTHTILERFSDSLDQFSSSDPGTSKRQQTLQATIEWSYNLLSDSDKILFIRLAVFSGGFDITAVEEVCSDDQLPKEIILDKLSLLVDRSLIYTVKSADQSMRYNRLETLRQFAQQKLQSQKEENVIMNRHLQYFLKIAEEAYEEQLESQLKWLNKLEQEHDNLIAALDWSDKNFPKEFVRLAGALGWFWSMHSHISEGKDYLERALLKDEKKSKAHARVLYGLAMIVFYIGEIPRSIDCLDESLKIWRQHNNLWEQAIVLSYFSFVMAAAGDQETGLRYSEESVEIARKIGNPILINYCMIDLCQSFVHLKQYDKARRMIKEFLDSADEQKQSDLIIRARRFLGDCDLGEENYLEAEKGYGFALETALKYGNTLDAAFELLGIAFSVSGQSRWAKSIRLDAAAREKGRLLGVKLYGLIKFYDVLIDTYIGRAREKLGEERTRKYEEEGKTMGFDAAVEYSLDFEKD
jgi:predicted ATPase